MAAPVNPKVSAATTAGGLAGAFTVIVVYAVGQAGVDVPPEVASAFTTLIAGGFAFLGGYLKSPQP